jgi:hypothetical protein
MGTDDILKQILEALKRLERGLPPDEPPRSASSRPPDPRATEQFPRVELAIKDAIEKHSDKCLGATKERITEKTDPLEVRIEKLETDLKDALKDLKGRILTAKEDAAKTAAGPVISLEEKVRLVMESLKGVQGEPGLEEMVRDLGQWVETEEQTRRDVAEKSKFNLTTFLEIIGILTGIGLGLAGIFLK